MTAYKPTLIIKRLVIYSIEGKVAYDQSFHTGVNIIRGFNSLGKSTISNFIYYILGGDFTDWSPEALRCEKVLCEIQINDAVITLQRKVSSKGRQGLAIFYDSLDRASQSIGEGWKSFTYNRGTGKQSLSNVMFEILGLPEVFGDYDSNLTMNQLLRLLYLDQDSVSRTLIKPEMFDTPVTRKTIGELLFGVYNDQLYLERMKLRELEKELDDKKSRRKGIYELYGFLGESLDISTTQASLTDNEKELESVQEQLDRMGSNGQVYTMPESTEGESSREQVLDALIDAQRKFGETKSNIEVVKYEVFDSEQFILSLTSRLMALEEALSSIEFLQSQEGVVCIQCLEVTNDKSDCPKCQQGVSMDKQQGLSLRMKQEIGNQIRESKVLLEEKQQQLDGLLNGLKSQGETIIHLKGRYETLVGEVKVERVQAYEELLQRKGGLETKHEFLIQQLKVYSQLESLLKSIGDLERDVSVSKGKVFDMERALADRWGEVATSTDQTARTILINDLGRQ